MRKIFFEIVLTILFISCEKEFTNDVSPAYENPLLKATTSCWNGNIDWKLSSVRITKGSTNERIDALVFGGFTYYFYKGESSNKIYYSKGTSGGSFSESSVPGEESKESPAAAVFNNRLYIAFRGESSERIYMKYMTSSGTWSSHFTIGDEYSEIAPALVTFNNYLYVIFKGRTGDFNKRMRVLKLNSSHQVLERYWMPSNNQTGRSPYAVSSNGKLYVIYIGVSGNLWYTYYLSGQSWADPIKIQDIAFDFWHGQWGNTFNYVTGGSIGCRTYGVCGINTTPGFNQIVTSWDDYYQSYVTNVYFNGDDHTLIPLSPLIKADDYVYAYYPNHNNDIVEIKGLLRF